MHHCDDKANQRKQYLFVLFVKSASTDLSVVTRKMFSFEHEEKGKTASYKMTSMRPPNCTILVSEVFFR